MIRPGVVLGLARAEMRLTRRVVRFWVFLTIAALFAILAFANFMFIHWRFSFASASAASAYPRFFMGAFGSNHIFLFLAGLVFLGFDLRARDTRERMVEVLDSLPYRNIELVLGKYLGILIPSWVAVLGIAGLLMGGAAALGAPLEPWSVVAFVFLMAIPAYTFFIGFVFLLSSVVRHRLLVALLALAAVVLVWAAGRWWVPLYGFSILDVTGGFSATFPSDIIPRMMDPVGMFQRAAYLLMGFGLLWLAAATHPRLDDGSRGAQAGIGLAILLAGASVCGVQIAQAKGAIDQRQVWRKAHEARADQPAPDLRAMTGEVRIDPGRALKMELELLLAAPEGQTLETAIFSLNPGLRVADVVDESGTLTFRHEAGMLAVDLSSPLTGEQVRSIRMAVEGAPNTGFAYLDATLEPFSLKGVDAALLILGYESNIFRERHVALLPGTRWLPASGTEASRGDPRVRPLDFYDLDLTVDVPEGWTVAGPGRRQERPVEDSGRARYRFAPPAPLPDVALVAGRYEGRSVELGGVLLEVLLTPKHADVFDTFTDADAEIRDWLSEKLDEAAELGLGYPYDALTMVEVPNELRGYGGGWRMDSTLIQPAMILVRESGFPTARYSTGFKNPERFKEREGGLPRYKRETLETFFENDMNGGNPFIAAARSFFGFQTAGRGAEGLPLDFVFESLSSRLVTERKGYFSYRIFDETFGQDFINAGQQMRDPDRVGESYNDVLIHMLTSRPEVWETVLDVSLIEMDPWNDPEKAIDVLALKGGAMAQSMLDDLGRDKTGRFLADLRSSNAGRTYAREDVLASGQRVEENLAPWLDTWLEQTALPGFTVGGVRVDRVTDAEDGSPRYQSLLTVRNEEQVPGLIRIDYRVGDRQADRGSTDPVRIPAQSAVEIGVVTSKSPTSLRVSPYLSLNRDPFNVRLPGIDEEKVLEQEPFTGTRPVEWVPDDDVIVVDDLDPGFEVEMGDETSMLRVSGRGAGEDEVLDQGLPVTSSTRPNTWSRMSRSHAYGKYRHTLAVIRSGKGDSHAVFSTDLPRAGRWELEYHVPKSGKKRKGRQAGTWNLVLVDSSGRQEITFDAEGAESGWNLLGTFEVADGEVRVVVTNATDGDYVMADAVRWTPAAGDRAALR